MASEIRFSIVSSKSAIRATRFEPLTGGFQVSLKNIAFSHLRCNVNAARPKDKRYLKNGFRGVFRETDLSYLKKWKAVISVNGKRVTIGRYESREEASSAYFKKVSSSH